MNADRTSLSEILKSFGFIESDATVGWDRFSTERHWQSAIIREWLVVGEATKRLSPAFRGRYLEVDWRRLAGMRDRLIHAYEDIDRKVVWDAVENDLPSLKAKIERILAELPEEP